MVYAALCVKLPGLRSQVFAKLQSAGGIPPWDVRAVGRGPQTVSADKSRE